MGILFIEVRIAVINKTVFLQHHLFTLQNPRKANCRLACNRLQSDAHCCVLVSHAGCISVFPSVWHDEYLSTE